MKATAVLVLFVTLSFGQEAQAVPLACMVAFAGFNHPDPLVFSSDSSGLRIGDVNGDGNIDLIRHSPFDLVTPGVDREMRVDLGDGAGGFSLGSVIPIGESPGYVGDIDGDGFDDILVPVSSGFAFFRSNGDGTFSNVGTANTFGELRDFNNDGLADVVIVSSFFSETSVWIGDGSGAFAQVSSFPIPGVMTGSAFGDVNGDGFEDIVVLLPEFSEIAVYLGSSTGAISFLGLASLGQPGMTAVTIADMNGDGDSDLLVSSAAAALSLGLGDGTGTFAPLTTVDSTTAVLTPELAVADFDLDGFPDVVSGGGTSSGKIYFGDGTGSFPVVIDRGFPYGEPQVFAVDITSDGLPDLLTNWAGWINDTFVLVDCDGNGEHDPCEIESGMAEDCNENGIDTCDFATGSDANGDGILDECQDFIRGEINGDDRTNVADAVALLDVIFGGAFLDCADAGDVNDDGIVDASDPVFLLAWRFLGSTAPVEPVGTCGVDPTPDLLDCVSDVVCP